ncbi:MAG TPA: cupin domain-containing protein [Baekduia sp.]|jgi:quercetin dioxygenase-like cupin family protein
MTPPNRYSDAELESIQARYVGQADGAWSASAWPGLEARSLGLDESSSGLFGAWALRVGGGVGSDVARELGVPFHMIYVRRGAVTVVEADGTSTRLGPDDAVHHPAGSRFALTEPTDDLEAVELTERGPDRQDRGARRAALYAFDTPEASVLGAGPRPNVIYRDLGTAAATGGRIRMQVNQAEEPVTDMLIWHFHDMAQWFIVLDGWADVEVRDHPRYRVEPGDALCIGAGRGMCHNVANIGPGFKILELCTPATYETWSIDPPEPVAAT